MTNPKVFLDAGFNGASMGRIVIQLFADATPNTAERFRLLCSSETYKGSCFYQVRKEMCVGGGFIPCERGVEVGIDAEAENFVKKHDAPGTVSMVSPGGPEFFITAENIPHLDGQHVVVGRVVEGLDVVGKIIRLAGTRNGAPARYVHILGCGDVKEPNIPPSVQMRTGESQQIASTSNNQLSNRLNEIVNGNKQNPTPSQHMSTKEFQQVASTSGDQLSNSLKAILSVKELLSAVDPAGVVVPHNENELVEVAENFRLSLNVLSDLKTEVSSLETRHSVLLSETETKISSVKNKRLFLETMPSLSYEELENIEDVIKKRKNDMHK